MKIDGDPSVSIIIPVYNMAEYIGECISSILREDFDSIEVIVVNDGSTDDTEAVVRAYTDPDSERYDPRVIYQSQTNAGKSKAVNYGISIARGSFLSIVDADDQLTASSIERRYKARLEEGEGDLIIGGFEVFDRHATYGIRPAPSIDDANWLHDCFYMRWKTPFHLNACLISRNLMERVGGLDGTLHRCIDGDYALRLLKEAEGIITVNDVVYRYRKHRSSASQRLKYRLRTARYRPRVVWKNYSGWRQWVSVPFGIVVDAGKLVYELVDSYKK